MLLRSGCVWGLAHLVAFWGKTNIYIYIYIYTYGGQGEPGSTLTGGGADQKPTPRKSSWIFSVAFPNGLSVVFSNTNVIFSGIFRLGPWRSGGAATSFSRSQYQNSASVEASMIICRNPCQLRKTVLADTNISWPKWAKLSISRVQDQLTEISPEKAPRFRPPLLRPPVRGTNPPLVRGFWIDWVALLV